MVCSGVRPAVEEGSQETGAARDHGKLWADISAFRSRGRTQSGHRAALSAALKLEGPKAVTLVLYCVVP